MVAVSAVSFDEASWWARAFFSLYKVVSSHDFSLSLDIPLHFSVWPLPHFSGFPAPIASLTDQ